jgi:hypothetical protein
MSINDKLKFLADYATKQRNESRDYSTVYELPEEFTDLDKYSQECIDKYNKNPVTVDHLINKARGGFFMYDLFTTKKYNTNHYDSHCILFDPPRSGVEKQSGQNNLAYLKTEEITKKQNDLLNGAGKKVCSHVVDSFKKYCRANELDIKIKDECNGEKPNAYVYWGQTY